MVADLDAKHDVGICEDPATKELLAKLRKYRGRLPADFKFDRLDAHERGELARLRTA